MCGPGGREPRRSPLERTRHFFRAYRLCPGNAAVACGPP
ncbi:hypothetical protein FTUN_0238 [Frigoriglobus tundricola]|uniref:Uncharacterized protein n=1 Tax=Frigoriglobus tundricola TaxID=2774151 RepID=A0A6M5YH98_9BACT|nr:hypothetical protein FTUN_0238 [Frigoriglobus tundricola]